LERLDLSIDLAKELYRLACLGRMMGGLIHNLNGPLHGLGIELDMVRMAIAKKGAQGPDPAALENRLGGMEREIETLDRLIRLCSARTDDAAVIPFVDINGLLRDESEFLQANLYYKHQVATVLDLAQGMPVIESPPADLILGVQWLFREVVADMERQGSTSLLVATRYENHTRRISFVVSGKPLSTKFGDLLSGSVEQRTLSPSSITDLGLILSTALLQSSGVSLVTKNLTDESRLDLTL